MFHLQIHMDNKINKNAVIIDFAHDRDVELTLLLVFGLISKIVMEGKKKLLFHILGDIFCTSV